MFIQSSVAGSLGHFQVGPEGLERCQEHSQATCREDATVNVGEGTHQGTRAPGHDRAGVEVWLPRACARVPGAAAAGVCPPR